MTGAERELGVTRHRIAALRYEITDDATGRVLGICGGREGHRWAVLADGRRVVDDSPTSWRVVLGLLVRTARAAQVTP